MNQIKEQLYDASIERQYVTLRGGFTLPMVQISLLHEILKNAWNHSEFREDQGTTHSERIPYWFWTLDTAP